MDVGPRRVAWLLAAMTAAWLSSVRAAETVWLKIAAPDFTIVTSLDEKRALARANEFAQYVAALRSYFGDNKSELPALTMVVFGTERQFEQYCPRNADGTLQPIGGFFVRRGPWAVIGEPAVLNEQARHTIFHEGVHWFTNGFDNVNPPWFDEGMAEVFSTFRIEKNRAVWGAVLPEHVDLLHTKPLVPVEKLLQTARDRVLEDEGYTEMFYAESWALAHMLTFGDTKIPRSALATYAQLLAEKVPSDVAFQRAFKCTCAEADRMLFRYLDGGRYRISRRPLVKTAPLTAERAPAMDVDDALGRLALSARLHAVALSHGMAMALRDPTDPRGHALIGLARKESGREPEALEELEVAVRCGSLDFEPYFEVGRALQKAASESGTGMSGGDARRAANCYARAIDLYPRFESAYTNFAGVVGFADPITERDRAVLAEGARRFPDNKLIALGEAQVAHRNGDNARAKAILEPILSRSGGGDDSVARFATQLKEGWEAEEISGRVNALVGEKKYEAALTLLEQRTKTCRDPSLRYQMEMLRHQLEVVRTTSRLNDALGRGAWIEARQVIDDLVASEAPPATKARARQILADLDRRNLGFDPRPPEPSGTPRLPLAAAATVDGK